MKGIHVKKAQIVNEDSRRRLLEIMNGQMNGKNIKILEVKEEGPEWQYLGGTSGHWHQYPECMFIYKGECKDYIMENVDTGEKETFNLGPGDTVFRTGRIIHGGMFKRGSIVIDIAEETYISDEFNDIPREVTK